MDKQKLVQQDYDQIAQKYLKQFQLNSDTNKHTINN